MTPLIIFIIFTAIILTIVRALLSGRQRYRPSYLYRKQEYLMTQAEHKCFNALEQAVGDVYYIFPQVHLPSILDHKIKGQNWRGAFSHINQKSVDFVLCDKIKLNPILAIELDDWSHALPERKERDGMVEQMLKDAKMPLLRLKDHSLFENQIGLRQAIQMAAGVGV